jgi:hypothetical protein
VPEDFVAVLRQHDVAEVQQIRQFRSAISVARTMPAEVAKLARRNTWLVNSLRGGSFDQSQEDGRAIDGDLLTWPKLAAD